MSSSFTSSDLEKGRAAVSASVLTHIPVATLSWRDVSVTVKTSDGANTTKSILTNAYGHVAAGELVAFMGPSGSGKTTLLNFLGARKVTGASGSSSGDVLFGGASRPLSVRRQISAYVEQEDALIGSLTAEETLRFTGRLAMPQLSRREINDRAASIIQSMGLSGCRNTKVGTPIQKGLSGGQKRRVSVASQLMTAPSVLFLDEPTSGLDSTASFEVMSYLQRITKKHSLITVVSIHQPSTKTFQLFDKICLLSRGSTCYFGPTSSLQGYLEQAGHPIPSLTNPAEHLLDLANTDFDPQSSQQTLNSLLAAWQHSNERSQLLGSIDSLPTTAMGNITESRRPVLLHLNLLLVLIHRGFLKGTRDVVAYWIRLIMYTGLAIMMGTVWLRLDTNQESIQPFINSIDAKFFASAFMSFMAVAYVPAFLEDRTAFVKERANGLYGPLAFNLANFLVGLPYLFVIVIIFSVISYWLINLEQTADSFFRWIMWLYLDLLAAESMVVFFASVFPNFVLSLALIAFANGLWMCVGGFLVSPTILNVFWRYVFHYIDYQAYVFQGMMVNEFAKRTYDCAAGCHCSYQSSLAPVCKIDGLAVLESFAYPTGRTGKWVGILLGITAVYRLFAWIALWARKN